MRIIVNFHIPMDLFCNINLIPVALCKIPVSDVLRVTPWDIEQ